MTEIKLTKRYPQSRTEDIVDAYMRGWNDALDAVQNGKFIINDDRKAEPQTENPCDGCVCDDGKHLMYCMNCKGIAWKTEPPKVEDEPQTERSSE